MKLSVTWCLSFSYYLFNIIGLIRVVPDSNQGSVNVRKKMLACVLFRV